MAVFGPLKLSEYEPHRHTLPIAHDNLRIADNIYMNVHPDAGEMYLSWHSTMNIKNAMPGMVLENAAIDQPVKILALGSPSRTESIYIWARNKTAEDKPSMARHPQLTRQQMADQLDHAFSELEEWSGMIDGITNSNENGTELILSSAHLIAQLNYRIKTLIERLSEYK